MKVFKDNIELFPAKFKGCLITSSGKVKLINNENDTKEYAINDIVIVDNDSQNTINNLKQENQKLQNDVKSLLRICEKYDITVFNENGDVVVEGRNSNYQNNQSSNHHTEQVVYEDNTSDLIFGIAVGTSLF